MAEQAGVTEARLTTMESDSEPLVTVIIPARNEEDFIERCVNSIREQTHKNLQILVIDGDSDDATVEIVERIRAEDPRVEIVPNPDRLIPVGLNRAIERTRGEWLVRVDAHSTVPPDYVARAASHLVTGKWGGVGGRKDGVGLTPAGRAIAAAMESKFGVGNSTYHHGTELQTVEHIPFGCYPVAVIKEVGGWDEKLAVNQDFEFDHRVQEAGYELLFDPELHIDWHCRQDIPAFYRQYRRYGKGKTKVMRLHPESISPRHLAAPALVAGLAGAAAIAPKRPGLAAGFMGLYGLANAAASALTASKLKNKRDAVHLPAAFGSMHIGWGIGFFEGWWQQLRGKF